MNSDLLVVTTTVKQLLIKRTITSDPPDAADFLFHAYKWALFAHWPVTSQSLRLLQLLSTLYLEHFVLHGASQSLARGGRCWNSPRAAVSLDALRLRVRVLSPGSGRVKSFPTNWILFDRFLPASTCVCGRMRPENKGSSERFGVFMSVCVKSLRRPQFKNGKPNKTGKNSEFEESSCKHCC